MLLKKEHHRKRPGYPHSRSQTRRVWLQRGGQGRASPKHQQSLTPANSNGKARRHGFVPRAARRARPCRHADHNQCGQAAVMGLGSAVMWTWPRGR